MKNRIKLDFFITALLFTIVLVACSNLGNTDLGSGDFYAIKADGSNQTYITETTKLAESAHSIVYAENNSGVSVSTAQAVANEFESIYTLIRDNFGLESDVDGNGKIILLLLDIQDGFTGTGGYVAGYFDAYHLFDATASNKKDMLFLDTNPLVVGSSQFYATLAHEFQHLVNFNENYMRYGTEQHLWINEGLSSAAEYLYRDDHDNSRISYLDSDSNNTFVNGNNFYVWSGNENDVLMDYSTVYTFFQWLRLHSGNGSGIYKNIMDSSSMDYNAVVGAVNSNISLLSSADWPRILSSWYLSLYIQDSSSIYGFKNDFSLTANLDSSGSSESLFPGEGVVDRLANDNSGNFVPSNPPANSYYVGFSANGDVDFDSSGGYDGQYLLVLNSSTNISDPSIAVSTSTFNYVDIVRSYSVSDFDISTSEDIVQPIPIHFANPLEEGRQVVFSRR